jgi:hypothetical protein
MTVETIDLDHDDTADIAAKEESLTDWENPPTVADLQQDFNDAQSDHSGHVADIDRWLANLNITSAPTDNKPCEGRSTIQPKLIRKQAEWRYSALADPFLSTDDIFNTTPVTFEDKTAAYQNGLILNTQFNHQIKKVMFVNDYIHTAVDEGTVIVRVAWDYKDIEEEVEVPVFRYVANPQTGPVHQQLHQMMQENPEAYQSEVPPHIQEAHRLTMENGVPVEAIEDGTEMETVTRVLVNQPSLQVCNYNNVVIDPTANGDIDQANFIIYTFETSLSELEKEGIYDNLDELNIVGSSALSDPDYDSADESDFNFSDTPRKKFTAKEYWGFWDIDGDGTTKPIVATYVDAVMIRLELNPFPDQKLPFVVAQYLPVRRQIYGQPDGEILEDNQKIVGAVTRGMIDIMGRSANGQMATRKDALDVTNKRKFNRGEDYEFNAGIDPRQAFHMHTYPEIPQSAEFMLSLQNNEAESLTGVKAFNQGISGQALGNTATGIRSALDATAKRELDILRRLAEGIKEIGYKIMSMNAEFLSEEEVVRITNEEFVQVRREDLQGNVDIDLSISTAEADNQKAEELAFMLQTVGNSLDPGLTQVILADIAKLRKMPTLAKSIETYKPEPDPIAEEMKRLQVELLKAQVANENASAFENQAGGTLDLAKADTEKVKQGNTSSDTDQKNLDFVEQESGVKQERDLQKAGAQARANERLKAFEFMLNEIATKEKPSAK